MTERTAVAFDTAAFRAWLDSTPAGTAAGAETNKAANQLLATSYERLDGDGGWLAEVTLHSLATEPGGQAAWTYGDGVSDVKVWTVAHQEGGGGDGIVGEVTVDGVPLSLGRLVERDLIPAEHDRLPGYEAAEAALVVLAERVNAVADRFRQGPPAGDVVDGEVVFDSAYEAAAAATGHDVNHRAHPVHW